MAVTEWKSGRGMPLPSVNPNGALIASAKSFDSMANQANNRRNVLLAERSQDWVESEPERLLAQQQQTRERENLLARNVLDARNLSGGSLAGDFFGSKEAQEVLQGVDWNDNKQNEFVRKNLAAFSDPTAMKNTMRDYLIQEKGWGYDKAEAAGSKLVADTWKTLDSGIGEKLLVKPFTQSNSSLASSGYVKPKAGAVDSDGSDLQILRDDIISVNNLKKGTETSIIDIASDYVGAGGYSVNEQQLDKIVALVAGTPGAGSERGILNAIKMRFDNDSDLKFNPENPSKSLIESLVSESKTYDNNQNRLAVSQGTASSDFNNRIGWNQSVINRMSPNAATKADRLALLRHYLGKGLKPEEALQEAAKDIEVAKTTGDLMPDARSKQTSEVVPAPEDPAITQYEQEVANQDGFRGIRTNTNEIVDGTLDTSRNFVSNFIIPMVKNNINAADNSLSWMLDGDVGYKKSKAENAANSQFNNDRLMKYMGIGEKPAAVGKGEVPGVRRRPTKVGDTVYVGSMLPRPVKIESKEQLKQLQESYDKQNSK